MKENVIRSWIFGVLAGVYKPQPKETIWEWAERTLKMPRGGENDEMAGKPWSSAYSPYLREVMEWFRTPGKCQLYIAKSSQVGVTMACLIVICWHIVHRPVNVGYYIDSEKEARKISKSRLKPWIKQNNLLQTEIGEEKDDLSNMTYFLKGMVVYLMGTYGTGAFRNKALGIAILDEFDAHPPVDGTTTGDLADGRVKRHKNSKKIAFSTPLLEEGQTWQGYLRGTQEKFFVPCPCCNHVQPLEWKRVRYTGKEFEDLAGERDEALILEHAYYECELGCRIEHAQKFNMLQLGEWRATNLKASPRIRSMHISDLYSHFVSWGELALEWIAAQKNLEKLRAFINQRLGEPFRQASGTLREGDVLKLRERYEVGQCPINPALMALVVDVQHATMKWVIVAFSTTGDLFVIEWGEASTWDEIAELAYREIPVPGGVYQVECGLIDEGDGNRTKEVREFTYKHDHLFPVKGRGKNQMPWKDLYRTSFSTLYEPDDVLTYQVNDNIYKRELLFRRIKRDQKQKDYDLGRLVLPWRITPEFVAELLAERVEQKKNKYGFPEEKWVVSGSNDYLDCLKYALALWTIMEPDLRAVGRLAA